MLNANVTSTKGNETMLTTDELTVETASLSYPRSGNREDRSAYYSKIAAFEHQWAEWLASEYATYLPATVHSLIYKRAWADGHSDGYNAVENRYSEYAEFATEVSEATAANAWIDATILAIQKDE
jgi:hypothetical protein